MLVLALELPFPAPFPDFDFVVVELVSLDLVIDFEKGRVGGLIV